jgi:hypothetical protein
MLKKIKKKKEKENKSFEACSRFFLVGVKSQ